MHEYELKIIQFMQTVATSSVEMDKLFEPSFKDVQHFLKKMHEDDPNRPFSLRLSSVGRPLCMSQMHKNKAAALEDEWNFPLRMFFGGVIEASTVAIMKAAGINIEEEQTHVILDVEVPASSPVDSVWYKVPGTLDLKIDGRIWDVKSASPYSFENKFASYESLKADDSFGYMGQLFGYAKARGCPPGGWIVIDKSSGIIKIIPVPDDYESDMKEQLLKIAHNVKILTLDAEFKRSYEDVNETFNKRFTGNKTLESPCIFCKFKYTCWPTLKYLPNPNSKAFDKPYKYYTVIGEKSLDENPVSESKGKTPTAVDSPKNLGEILDTL